MQLTNFFAGIAAAALSAAALVSGAQSSVYDTAVDWLPVQRRPQRRTPLLGRETRAAEIDLFTNGEVE